MASETLVFFYSFGLDFLFEEEFGLVVAELNEVEMHVFYPILLKDVLGLYQLSQVQILGQSH